MSRSSDTFLKITRQPTAMQYTTQLLPLDESEGIRDFYAVHHDLKSLYEQIVFSVITETQCAWTISDVEYRCNNHYETKGQCKPNCNEIRFKGVTNDAYPFEMSLSIFSSRMFPEQYGPNKNRVYLVRFNRLDGDSMTFLSMRRCIEQNTQSIFEGGCVLSELSMKMSLDSFDIVDDPEMDEKYDYSVYDDIEGEDEESGMVWV